MPRRSSHESGLLRETLALMHYWDGVIIISIIIIIIRIIPDSACVYRIYIKEKWCPSLPRSWSQAKNASYEQILECC